jgi:hypothetical protein
MQFMQGDFRGADGQYTTEHSRWLSGRLSAPCGRSTPNQIHDMNRNGSFFEEAEKERRD